MTTHVTEGPRFSRLCRPTLARAYTPFTTSEEKEKLLAVYSQEPTQSVCVANCYSIAKVLDLPFASPIAIYR